MVEEARGSHTRCQRECAYADEQSQDEEIVMMQDDYHEKFRRLKRWIIVQDKDGFTVHEWTIDGVAPPSTYATARLAASRLLQLLGLGPVGPQDHPEDVCVGTIKMDASLDTQNGAE